MSAIGPSPFVLTPMTVSRASRELGDVFTFAMDVPAAAQASGRRIAFRHHGHEPQWADGVGRFTGVAIAFDRRDFADAVAATGDLA